MSSEEGFLPTHTNNEAAPAPTKSCQVAEHDQFYEAFQHEVDEAPLNRRAWVLQERILSRRIIHFGTNHVYFECGEGVQNDRFVTIPDSIFFGDWHFVLDCNFPSRIQGLGNSQITDFVHTLYKDYTRRQLTNKSDRCVAIAGLETRIAAARNCKSLYGVFDQHLHRDLLWWRPHDSSMQLIDYTSSPVPSWSWMAYEGGIDYINVPRENVTRATNLRLDEAEQNNNSWFPKRSKHALVTDIGVFLGCVLGREGMSGHIHGSEMNVGHIWYDIEFNHDLTMERCVVVARQTFPRTLKWDRFYVLVVKPTRIAQEYERVGAGWIRSDHVKREKHNVRIV